MTDVSHFEDGSADRSPRDVRMRGFVERTSVEKALRWLDQWLDRWTPKVADVPLAAAAGSVLAEEICSPVAVPPFDRAMMDGYAVRGADTQGASSYHPLPLEVVGESLAGRPCVGKVGPRQALRIMTGAPMPQGADAVLPAEWAQAPGRQPSLLAGGEQVVEAIGDVAPGRHVGRQGEDVQAGALLLAPPRRLRPQDIGLLASIGRAAVRVETPVRAHLVVTGDELLPLGAQPRAGCIVDANGPMLDALLRRDGASPCWPATVPDDPDALLQAMRASPGDVILISGGSSVGQEDHAPVLLARHGQLAVHGVAMRPSSPAGFGLLDGRLVFLLPGNPVSCLCAYDFFVGRAVRSMGRRPREWPYPMRRCRLRRKLVSAVGRLDYARVRLVDGEAEPLAVSGASVLSSATRADGFVLAPADSEGFAAGHVVEVWLYDAT